MGFIHQMTSHHEWNLLDVAALSHSLWVNHIPVKFFLAWGDSKCKNNFSNFQVSPKEKSKNECFIYLPLILFTKVVLLRGRHAIEGRGCRHGVCTHVPEEEPVSHPELGEGAVLQNTVQSITGWSPNAATVTPFVTFLFVIMNKKRAWFIEITQFFPFYIGKIIHFLYF